MPQESRWQQDQQFEQIMATIFTCRSVVKYNLALSEEQRLDLLVDIDKALEVLRPQLLTSVAHDDGVLSAQNPHNHEDSPVKSEAGSLQAGIEPADKQALLALYRIYYAYLDESQNTNINTFVRRFNEVMVIINEVERLLENSPGLYDGYIQQPASGNALQNIRTFIADIYYIFMEFVRVLSDALRQNNVHLDTEKLSSLQSENSAIEKHDQMERNMLVPDLKPLFQIYDVYQQLDMVKGHMTNRVNEGTAFLEFLKERVSYTTNKRAEIIQQIMNITQLLQDMSCLLLEYEKALTLLRQ